MKNVREETREYRIRGDNNGRVDQRLIIFTAGQIAIDKETNSLKNEL